MNVDVYTKTRNNWKTLRTTFKNRKKQQLTYKTKKTWNIAEALSVPVFTFRWPGGQFAPLHPVSYATGDIPSGSRLL